MIVYRISSCRYINDLSGKGAALYGGRWSSRDTFLVYTAESRALALLEAVVHIGKIPDSYCMATIEIPDEHTETYPAELLPADWQKNPSPEILKKIGDRFVNEGKHLALAVPSVIMAEEHNYLLNPHHKEFRKVKIVSERRVRIDERLFPQA